MDVVVQPVERLRGSVAVPGDKSISHRALMLAAMARGRSVIRGLAPGADVASTLSCLRTLGLAQPTGGPSGEIGIEGLEWQLPRSAALDAGNSGTTMRLLAGAVAGRPTSCVLAGDASLSRRPMARVAVPLRLMGATVELAAGDRPPVRVLGGELDGIDYPMPVASAQVKSAVLLAGLQASGTTRLGEPAPSRDHTERFLQWLGVPLAREGSAVVLPPGPHLPLPGFLLHVPGDFSSAAFWIVAALLVPGSDVTLTGVGLNPSRTGLLDILALMGAGIEAEPGAAATADGPEPAGVVRVRACPLHGADVAGPVVANAIDELPLVAVAATQAEGVTTIRDAGELRVKESDRLAVLAGGLRALGADVTETPDGMVVHGPVRLHGGAVDAGGDHRMAMAFAVAALGATGPVTISGWESTAISYPGFLDTLGGLAS
ncbi:MAG TPA: 3-phosphoshikimate 1-carboxyvinyltransferase [Actinomycetota bacterium]|nr:3-phosphoshikimate 1-carboxyvinyltransferase [Actinomycetota bacterium]